MASNPMNLKQWRRERDSNPRYPFRYSGFQDRLFQPLTHPSSLLNQHQLIRDNTFVPSHGIALSGKRPCLKEVGRYQRCYIYEAFGAFHVRYRFKEIVDGKLTGKQRSRRLCTNDKD